MANNEKIDKDTFILRRDFYAQIQLLDRGQRGDLLTAIFAHAHNEAIPKLDGVTSMCFEFIRASIDSYSEKYSARCQRNRENGKKGGRPRKADGLESNQPDSEITERFTENPNGKGKSGRKNKIPIGTKITERFFENQTESEKTERVKKNHDIDSEYDSEYDIDYDNNTHTVNDCKERGVGKTNANLEIRDMLEWVAENYPDIQQMVEPFDATQMSWMLAKYDPEDIKRIIGDMDNKGAAKNKSAYSTFSSFAGRDTIIKEKKAATLHVGPQYYSYDEVLAFIHKHGGMMDEYFKPVKVEEKTLWVKK